MNAKGQVLVTGGSGYVAGFVIEQLLAEGWNVRTSVRSLAREEAVRKSLGLRGADRDSLKFVAADLMADGGWRAAAEGMDYVLHVASPIPTTDPKSDDELVIPAREGTLRVLRAARDAGVKRIVVTSSTAAVAYGHGSREEPYTEAEWSNAENVADSSAYERSKTLAERAAWAFMQREGGQMQMTTVNPGAVLGPVKGDDYSASIEIVKKLIAGEVPGCPRMGWPLVDVRDIADLHVRAMTHPDAAGERFLGAGDFLWMKDIARILRAEMRDKASRVPQMELPDWMVRLVAAFDPTVRARLFELGKVRRVSSAKAKRVLGWTTRPASASIVDCARSLLGARAQ